MSTASSSLNCPIMIEDIVVDMKSRMSLFVFGLSRLSSKEGKGPMLIRDVDIESLMIHVN